MSVWSEDFNGCSLEEVLRSQSENRAWSKELRLRTTALVNSRLANQINQADYTASRKLVQDEAAECRRRANLLDTQIFRLTVRPLPRQG
ncbi:MAG: hypothetical protein LAP38_13240 [Acidobacteriia bacterium]|nr:hypothetical protein [Terriglobia bacterium]